MIDVKSQHLRRLDDKLSFTDATHHVIVGQSLGAEQEPGVNEYTITSLPIVINTTFAVLFALRPHGPPAVCYNVADTGVAA